ncbi:MULTISPECIES: PDR/VanB family oxidoreductase [unclassified Variovorax]|uniref:PDR/VanB family oxidoreductase n=1 Tax=unclassified Variovorax TaxID=663243 RepID=UPI001BD6688C|nr:MULTISPECIES: PDR/VanB family oxidoreductase [unclassified Variovorax]
MACTTLAARPGERLRLLVESVRTEAEGIKRFELVSPDRGVLPPFEAGAHIDVQTPAGLVRQYSLLNDDRERHRYVIAVLRDSAGRGGSVAMHDAVHAGMQLTIGQPRNAFALDESTAPAVLVAGGIGVTPLLSMARKLWWQGRGFRMHLATRSAARTPFPKEIGESAFAHRVFLHHDDGPPASRLDVGRLADGLPPNAHLYLCGPAGFMEAVAGAAGRRADVIVHTEFFASPAARDEGGGAFELRLARSGTAMVVPRGVSILEMLQRHGSDVPTSCEQGICGTCMTTVLDGEVEHRDHFLSAREKACGNRMLVCVSRGRPGTTLTVDL